MLMFIFIVDSDSTEYFSKTLPGKILGVGFICGLTVAWIAGAFLVGLILIYMATDRSLQDLRLWLGGSQGKARIDQVRHDVEELEDGPVGWAIAIITLSIIRSPVKDGPTTGQLVLMRVPLISKVKQKQLRNDLYSWTLNTRRRTQTIIARWVQPVNCNTYFPRLYS
jgi:hypothetical protein